MTVLDGLDPAQIEVITGIISLVVTVALLSYLVGDNPLYRIALHTLIGVSIGYLTLIVLYQVIVPRLILPLLTGDILVATLALVPFLLFGFLIFKLSPTWSPIGNIATAYLIGVGAAVAVGGALTGTLLPQIEASWQGPNLMSSIVMVIGTAAALFYFQFTQPQSDRPQQAVNAIRQLGKGVIVFTLGIVYGGLILSGVAVFTAHINTLLP